MVCNRSARSGCCCERLATFTASSCSFLTVLPMFLISWFASFSSSCLASSVCRCSTFRAFKTSRSETPSICRTFSLMTSS
ncbi:hypothetical protein BDQ94DRAFT_149011 [Aspergillus welwitschiae]|uniref:Uncharacterized protein n=1 Tax=Aspergillus welwitschiae TaxID=1341132 RepID=A0A3F3PU19_9EURO|nr:hypothetical protein BDQ94DRAFT_149011 [Aspergillus welwitschiae]RDH30419.1 hypothetical protein BDQ94DRAFT_149011 [Aspergillus welwitschiae]